MAFKKNNDNITGSYSQSETFFSIKTDILIQGEWKSTFSLNSYGVECLHLISAVIQSLLFKHGKHSSILK